MRTCGGLNAKMFSFSSPSQYQYFGTENYSLNTLSALG